MNQHEIIYKMSGHTYIFEEIEMLVYGSGCHFEFGPRNQISPNWIDGDFFLMLLHTFLKLLIKYQLYIILFGVITHFNCTKLLELVLVCLCIWYKFLATVYWKEFPSRLHLIKIKSSFYKIFAWIYFLRWKIKTDIAQIGFCILFKNFKNLILSLDCLTLACLSVIWLNNGLLIVLANQITLEHIKYNISLY